MNKMILNAWGFSLAVLALASCDKIDLPPDTSSCVEKKIKELKREGVRNPPASVWQYQYNGQTVYYIPSYCCDAPGLLFDTDCNYICSPDGGFTGRGDGKCTDFFEKRTNERLIWQDERQY